MNPSIWTGMYGRLPLHEALRTLNGCGWNHFEISTEHLVAIETHKNPNSLIAKANDVVNSLKLFTPQAHALLYADIAHCEKDHRDRDIERLESHLSIASRLGVKIVVMHPGGWNSDPRPDAGLADQLNVTAFRRLGDVAGELGMRIGIENMPRPGPASAAEVLKLLDLIDHEAIGITLDTSHANMCSLDIPDTVNQFGTRLIATHFSDNHGSADEHLIPGGGNIDWPPVIKALRAIDYQGTINLEIGGDSHKEPELHRLKTLHALNVAKWLTGLRE